MFRRARLPICIGLSLVVAWCAGVRLAAGAQPPAESEKTPQPASPPGPAAANVPAENKGPKAAPPLVSSATDIMFLPGPDGELVPVPVGASLKDYLNWLQIRARGEKSAPAPFSVTSIALEGSADDERATLTAKIRVQLMNKDQWARVPLQMAEAILRSSAYTGSGEAVIDRYERETGYYWWFRGEGIHELTLALSVPVRKQLPSRRCELSLPSAPVSALQLRVPFPKVSPTVADKSTVSVKPLEAVGAVGAATEIEVWGLGSRLDLTWTPAPEVTATETVLEAFTSIAASLVDGESVTLEASQRVQALQGSFDSLRVRIPPGSDLLRIEGAQYQEHHAEPASLNQILVKLKKGTTGPVDLRWTVRAKVPPGGAPVVLEGFEVERARIQTGLVGVGVVGDFKVTRKGDEDRFVQRVNLSDLPSAMRQDQTVAGYRFLNQPFRLVLNVQKREPYVVVDPVAFLHFSPAQTDLEAVFPFDVSRGTLSEVRVHWPKWKQSGWILEPIEPAGRVDQVLTDGDPNPDLIRIRLIEPAKKPFELRLRAKRATPREQEPAGITVPLPEASSRGPLVVAVSRADNIEIDFKLLGMGLLAPLPAQTALKVPSPKDFTRSVHAFYRTESRQPEFTAALVLHQPEVRTEAEVRATLNGSEIAVRQKILVDAEYERLQQLKLTIPAALKMDQVRFYSQAGAELPAVRTRSSDGSPREVRLALDQPRIGRFEIEARYSLLRPPGAEPVDALIPIVQSGDAPFSSTRFTLSDATAADGGEPAADDAGWVKQPAVDGAPVWLASGPKASIALKLVRPSASSLRGVAFSKVLIRTLIDPEGYALNRAQYRIPASVPALTLSMPAGLRLTQAWYGKQPLSLNRGVDSNAGATDYEIAFPPHRAAGHEALLTLDFQSTLATPSRFSEVHQLLQPLFSQEVWMPQILWDVVLPENQHLFSDPPSSLPEFRWRNGGLFWRRTPNLSADELAQWIAAADGPPSLAALSEGNSYLFGQFGQPHLLLFRTMNQASLVLVGAGLALVLGLILVKFRVARSALTVLFIAFGISVVGLWFASPVLVLLQPAALGLLLAVAAAGIDGIIKRRRRRGVVTLTSPSGFMTAPSSVNRDRVVGVGSDEFTSIRPAMTATADTGSAAGESGNR